MQVSQFKWKEHTCDLMGAVAELFRNNSHVDLTLAAEGNFLKVHKLLLSACSPYFQILLSQESERNPIIFLKDVKFKDLKYVIDFIYYGSVEVSNDDVESFLSTANSLQISALKTLSSYNENVDNTCENVLRDGIITVACGPNPIPKNVKKMCDNVASEEILLGNNNLNTTNSLVDTTCDENVPMVCDLGNRLLSNLEDAIPLQRDNVEVLDPSNTLDPRVASRAEENDQNLESVRKSIESCAEDSFVDNSLDGTNSKIDIQNLENMDPDVIDKNFNSIKKECEIIPSERCTTEGPELINKVYSHNKYNDCDELWKLNTTMIIEPECERRENNEFSLHSHLCEVSVMEDHTMTKNCCNKMMTLALSSEDNTNCDHVSQDSSLRFQSLVPSLNAEVVSSFTNNELDKVPNVNAILPEIEMNNILGSTLSKSCEVTFSGDISGNENFEVGPGQFFDSGEKSDIEFEGSEVFQKVKEVRIVLERVSLLDSPSDSKLQMDSQNLVSSTCNAVLLGENIYPIKEESLASMSSISVLSDIKETSPQQNRPKKQYFCMKCNKSFSSSSNLKRHGQTHNENRVKKTPEQRSKSAPKQVIRIRKKRRHVTVRCHLCGLLISEKQNLKRHIRIHFDDKPYKCNECGKSFIRNDYLKCHLRNHGRQKVKFVKYVESDDTISMEENNKNVFVDVDTSAPTL